MERVRRRLQADLQYARSRNPKGYGEADVERVVDEVRTEMHAKKDRKWPSSSIRASGFRRYTLAGHHSWR
ncbi:MAG: hypothetical protein ACLQOO_05985 [Terriglobia bacterium]